MTTGTDGFFTMQGIERHVSRFKAQLDMPNTLAKNRHILIRGPRGSGKSYFLDIFKDHIHSSNPPVRLNCAAINADLADSELFGHVAGAYTDAKKDNEGFIKTASNSGKVLILEEFNSLSPATQGKLLVFMEHFTYYQVGGRTEQHCEIRIVATMNYEEGTDSPRKDVLDRFAIVVDVPPLYLRRDDILYYIAKKYHDLRIANYLLLSLYNHNWPGNFRELDRHLTDLRYKIPEVITSDYINHINYREQIEQLKESIIEAGLPEKLFNDVNHRCFGDMISGVSPGAWLTIKIIGDEIKIVREKGGKEDCGDISSVSLFFKIVYGQSATYSPEPILNLKPFNEQAAKYIDHLKREYQSTSDRVKPWERFFRPSRKPSEIFLIRSFLTVSESLCNIAANEKSGDNHTKGAEQETIDSLKVAKYILGGDNRFFEILNKLLFITTQKKISEILGISTSTMNRWSDAVSSEIWPPPKKQSPKQNLRDIIP